MRILLNNKFCTILVQNLLLSTKTVRSNLVLFTKYLSQRDLLLFFAGTLPAKIHRLQSCRKENLSLQHIIYTIKPLIVTHYLSLLLKFRR